MSENIIVSGLAGVATYFGHSYLHGGLWESIPFATTETGAVGLGLAGLAVAGTYLAIEVGK